MKSPNNIIILSPGFAKNESDDNCIPPLQLLIKKQKEMYPETNISVIAFHYPFEESIYQWNNITVYAAGGKNKKGLHKIKTWWKVFKYYNSIRKQFNHHVIHSFWLNECFALGQIFSKIFKVLHLSTVMGQDAKKGNRYLNFFKSKNNTIICCSHFASQVLKKNYQIDCKHIIPFGTEKIEFFTQTISSRQIDVLGVGNLGPIKCFDKFIRVINTLKKDFPSICCEIAGEGELRCSLEKQIEELGLKENIKLLGNIKRHEVIKKMQQSKILLHTSDYEGQCYVYLEALGAGANVVALNRGYLPISSKVKICESEVELTSAVLSLLKSPLDHTPFFPVEMSETVQQYQAYYTR